MGTSEDPKPDASATEDAQMTQDPGAESAAPPPGQGITAGRKRPRLDLTTESREHKRGKSMFGILVGTLNKAKKEDSDRNASEAARKRAGIDKRLQNQLAEENDNVRRAEELKRDRQTANRKEEDLKLREAIYQNRRARLPALARFLLTSDKIPSDDSDEPSPNPPSINPLAAPPRTHPPPLFYLPAILTRAQAAFVESRTSQVKEAAEKEWEAWLTQRKEGNEEVEKLRARVEEEEAKRRAHEMERNKNDKPKDGVEHANPESDEVKMDESQEVTVSSGDMDTDKGRAEKDKEPGREGDVAMEADGDDAVEY